MTNFKKSEELQEITVKISRFDSKDPEKKAPELVSYTVKIHEDARVLDVLKAVRDTVDQTLTFRYCCGAGQCGSCAVKINGKPHLACMTKAVDGIVIEPLDLPVIKDLMTDLKDYLKDMPYLVSEEEDEKSDACELFIPSNELLSDLKPLRECIECLCCVSACPALKVTQYAGPTHLRQEMRLALDPRDKRSDSERIKSCVDDDGLFKCTTCQACFEVCPKKIKIPSKAIEKLRILAHREGLTLTRHHELAELIKKTGRSVEKNQNSKKLLDIIPEVLEPYGEVKETVGFFTGCLYDLRMADVALCAIEVLRRNGVRIITPKEQVCCGSPLIRTGQVEIVSDLMKRNIEAFTKRGIKTVMTICAGCGSTLKNDYDAPFTIKDSNEILTELGIEPPEKLDIRVTYHDPCHLLRGQGIHDQPRELISAVAREFVEIPSECCGSGGGVKSGHPEIAHDIGMQRAEEIKESRCNVVLTSCPFCEIHLKSITDKPVKNINTILYEAYMKKDELAGCKNTDGSLKKNARDKNE